MNDSFNRKQVDAITAPWLSLCKEQEERIEELEAELDRIHSLHNAAARIRDEYGAALTSARAENHRLRKAIQEQIDGYRDDGMFDDLYLEAILEGSKS